MIPLLFLTVFNFCSEVIRKNVEAAICACLDAFPTHKLVKSHSAKLKS